MTLDPKQIFSRINRGIILDIIVLVVNTLLMTVLAGRLKALTEASLEKDPEALASTSVYIAAITILPAAAAVLKFLAGNRFSDYRERAGGLFPTLLGVILVGQFILQSIFVMVIFFNRSDLLDLTYENPLVSWPLLALAWLAIVSVIIYPIFTYCHFFIDTTKWQPSRFRFGAEVLADLCLFVNLILYQAFWGRLMIDLPNDIESVVGRISQFLFAAVLIYIPPRIFYLADDGGRPVTWIMILAANLPILISLLFF